MLIDMNLLALFNRIQPRYLPLITAVFAVIVLLAFWQVVPGGSFRSENDDHVNYYLPVGKNIAAGQGITLNGKPALDYPPGYPVIVAVNLTIARLTGLGENAVMRLSFLVLFAAAALLIYALAHWLWGPRPALLASMLWSCYPVVLWSAKNPSSELPFSVFLYATLFCTLQAWVAKKRNALLFVGAGMLCGLAMLIRPIIILLGPILAVLVLFGKLHGFRKRAVLALCLVAGNLAAVIPWEAWAFTKTHEIIPLSSNGRASITLFDGLTFAVWNPFGCRKGISVPADVRALMTEAHDKYLPVIETTRPEELRKFFIEKFKAQPVTVIKLIAIKIVRSWYGTFTNSFETPILFVQLLYLSLLLWSGALVWRSRPAFRYIIITGAAILFYFWGLTVIVDPLVRYMMPVLGALIVFFPAVPKYFIDRPRKANQ